MSPTRFIGTPREAEEAIAQICRYPVCGLDSEFYGVDISSQSCVGRSNIHVFSVSIPSGELSPLGFNYTEDFVFPVTVTGLYNALTVPGVLAFLSAGSTKAIHNQPVDSHSFANHGVFIRGGINTLAMARWLYPQLARKMGRPFALDNLATWRAGVGKTEGFKDLFGIKVKKTWEDEGVKTRCECGALSCRKKKDGHTQKWPEMVKYETTRTVDALLPLTDLHPAHPLWARYMDYAARDASLALMMYQIMLRDGEKERAYPWNPFWVPRSSPTPAT
jgi:hypothetical protein